MVFRRLNTSTNRSDLKRGKTMVKKLNTLRYCCINEKSSIENMEKDAMFLLQASYLGVESLNNGSIV